MCEQCDKVNGTNLFDGEQPQEPNTETPKDEAEQGPVPLTLIDLPTDDSPYYEPKLG